MRVLHIAVITILYISGSAFADTRYIESMTLEHSRDNPDAQSITKESSDTKISAGSVIYGEIAGKPLEGYVATPEGKPNAPGILVIHEWWGLNDNVRAMARRFAHAGYAVLAVDLYGGEVAYRPDGARTLMNTALKRTEDLGKNLIQAHTFLTERGAQLTASVGWCFGGTWSLRTALLLPGELDAAVVYYGWMIRDPIQLASLTTPIIGFFGGKDQGIPVEEVKAFESILNKLDKSIEIHIYDDAGHAFANPSGGNFQEIAATDAWIKTLDFLERTLSRNKLN